MKIGILGFPLINANKGCEALTYSLINILVDIIREQSIEIYAFNIKINHKLEEAFPNIKFNSVRAKIKDFSVFKEFKKCDVIFDVTAGDGFSDIYFKRLVFKTTLMKECAILSGVPLVLMPQTYGPFNNLLLKKFALHTIKRSRRAYSRDQKSIDFINKYIKKDIMLVTDLAFALPYTKEILPSNGISVGLNVSGLLWRGGFNSNNQFGLSVNYQDYIKKIINDLNSRGYDIHLIPHVIENENDNIDGDVKICKEIYEGYLKKGYSIKIAPAFDTPIEAKNYICKMDVFIGARMHSTIAAFSAGVPVIPFSYSRKFEGLYENLNYPYLIHGCSDSLESAINNTLNWIEERDHLKQKINAEMDDINFYLSSFKEDLKNIVME